MKALEILDRLTLASPVKLVHLPSSFGIYALWDHENNIRYIGCTPRDGFRKRIYNRHKSGNEGQSHKFSQAYCCGRMWRYKETFHGKQFEWLHRKSDANIAKKLRNAFIERYCSASYIEIAQPSTGSYKEYLEGIEREVQELAPVGMRNWESKLFPEEPEPTQLVDSLISDGMCISETAVNRQLFLYNEHVRDR